ncbi:hypothetical protein BL243_08025 [Ralstonia solanacearum]|nr:hypothetical protein BL243_08025 [Ralstonia solanacearum]
MILLCLRPPQSRDGIEHRIFRQSLLPGILFLQPLGRVPLLDAPLYRFGMRRYVAFPDAMELTQKTIAAIGERKLATFTCAVSGEKLSHREPRAFPMRPHVVMKVTNYFNEIGGKGSQVRMVFEQVPDAPRNAGVGSVSGLSTFEQH